MLVELKNGNPDALDGLFRLYSNKVYGFAMCYFKNHADAEDLVQEVFYLLWKYKHNIDENKNFDSYLFVVSMNAVRKRFNEQAKEKTALGKFSHTTPRHSDEVVLHSEYKSLHEIILKAIEDLPPRQKEIYIMSREKGFSNADIAEFFNIKKKTVENQLNRVIKYLKKYLINNEILGFFITVL